MEAAQRVLEAEGANREAATNAFDEVEMEVDALVGGPCRARGPSSISTACDAERASTHMSVTLFPNPSSFASFLLHLPIAFSPLCLAFIPAHFPPGSIGLARAVRAVALSRPVTFPMTVISGTPTIIILSGVSLISLSSPLTPFFALGFRLFVAVTSLAITAFIVFVLVVSTVTFATLTLAVVRIAVTVVVSVTS